MGNGFIVSGLRLMRGGQNVAPPEDILVFEGQKLELNGEWDISYRDNLHSFFLRQNNPPSRWKLIKTIFAECVVEDWNSNKLVISVQAPLPEHVKATFEAEKKAAMLARSWIRPRKSSEEQLKAIARIETLLKNDKELNRLRAALVLQREQRFDELLDVYSHKLRERDFRAMRIARVKSGRMRRDTVAILGRMPRKYA